MRARLLLAAALLQPGRAEWAVIDNTVYDCEYSLTQVQCLTCQGIPTSNEAFFNPKSPSCISSAEGCCKSDDGFEYFRKDSLANYGVGDTVAYFYPGLSGDVILSGCSAGGLTTILHADKVAAQLSDVTTSFRAMPFSGFFPITPNFQGDPWFRVMADNVYKMQRVEPSLNEACLADNAGQEQRCFEAEHAYRYIKTPIFLINR